MTVLRFGFSQKLKYSYNYLVSLHRIAQMAGCISNILNQPNFMLSLDTGGDEDGDTESGLTLPEAETEAEH